MNNVLLIVLDGVGINEKYKGNAVSLAKMPCFDMLTKKYSYTQLGASEHYVGLLKGQIGSSEVGHSVLGAGRLLNFDLTRINKSIKDGSFFKNKVLLNAISSCKKNNKNIHLIGLLSDGGVHSHITHLYALLDLLKEKKVKNVYLHIITDGRDVSPTSGIKFVKLLQKKLLKINLGTIASISGRFYAMDRDNRWNRLKLVYDMLVYESPCSKKEPISFIKESYKKNISDEFLIPTKFNDFKCINNNDTIIFYNFRSDRAREFTKMFTNTNFNSFPIKKLNVNYISFTEYDASLKNKVKVVFNAEKILPGVGQILSKKNYKQLRIAETEKYAHVTYFFNQGQEFPNKKEDRILVPSPKIKTYDLKPEMSANKITNEIIFNLSKNYKFILVNFANGDMVGHTGNISATVKGLEFVDKCLYKIYNKLDLSKTTMIIVADHGNCDLMINKDGSMNTSHSLSKVPFILVTNKKYTLKTNKLSSLANVGPTVLKLLDIDIPNYMQKPLI